MGLVQNLKKRLGRWAERILVELSYHYIIQREKKTTKTPDKSLQIESSPNSLTMEPQGTTIVTSSQGTSEKITMELKTTEDIVAHNREWAIDKLESTELVGDKIALYAEFEDWIELDDVEELEIVSMEEQNDESE